MNCIKRFRDKLLFTSDPINMSNIADIFTEFTAFGKKTVKLQKLVFTCLPDQSIWGSIIDI